MRAALLLCLLPIPALAEDCTDRAREALGAVMFDGQPYSSETEMSFGTQVTKSVFDWKADDHFRTTSVEPEGSPDSLYYQGVYYGSTEDGGWSESNRMDAGELKAQADEMRNTMAEKLVSADCQPVDRDGASFEAMTMGIAQHEPYESDIIVTRLYDAEGQLTAVASSYMMQGQEVSVRQNLTPAPDLDLPVPSGD